MLKWKTGQNLIVKKKQMFYSNLKRLIFFSPSLGLFEGSV